MSFIYNGRSSDEFGLIVEQYPPRPFPSRKSDVYSIPGRSGDLIVEQDAFTNYIQPYEVYISPGSVGMQRRAALIARWLLGSSGYNRLIDEYDPTVYRDARFMGGFSFLNALNKFGRATIEFDCKPQRWIIDAEVLSGVIGDTFTIPTIEGAMPGKPMITINDFVAGASATIETDALRIVIPGQEALKRSIYISFETKTITALPRTLQFVSITGDWEALGDGAKIYTTLDTGELEPRVTIQPRRFYL